MTEHERLVREAETAMMSAGKIPAPRILEALSDDQLREIIAWYSGPLIVY